MVDRAWINQDLDGEVPPHLVVESGNIGLLLFVDRILNHHDPFALNLAFSASEILDLQFIVGLVFYPLDRSQNDSLKH
jgi:hypothetical protein